MHPSILFLIPYPASEAYALTQLQRVFYAAGEAFTQDPSRVHFGFTDLTKGAPKGLPDGFRNTVGYTPGASLDSHLERYIRDHSIRMVVLFDVQSVDPFVGALRRAGILCVVSYWGAPISSVNPLWKRSVKRLLRVLAGRNAVDALIFESNAMAEGATRGQGWPEARVDVVYPGVDVERFRPGASPQEDAYARQLFDIPGSSTLLVFAGHLHERKGAKYLMDAMLHLTTVLGREDIVLLCCGDRGGESEQWGSRLHGTKAESRVIFGGFRSDMPEIFRSADIGIIPSSGWDSFTLSSLEMQASGLPVITTQLGGLPEAVLNGQTGLVVPPSDAKALANAIVALADDSAMRNTYGQNAHARCVSSLSTGHHQAGLAGAFARRWAQSRAG